MPTYLLEHLATFTVSPENDLVYPADGMRRLLAMEKTSGIWTQKVTNEFKAPSDDHPRFRCSCVWTERWWTSWITRTRKLSRGFPSIWWESPQRSLLATPRWGFQLWFKQTRTKMTEEALNNIPFKIFLTEWIFVLSVSIIATASETGAVKYWQASENRKITNQSLTVTGTDNTFSVFYSQLFWLHLHFWHHYFRLLFPAQSVRTCLLSPRSYGRLYFARWLTLNRGSL